MNKINGRIPQDEMDAAYQKALESNDSIKRENLSFLREALTRMIDLLNENIDHIGAFSVVFVAKQDDSIVDPFDPKEPTTDAMGKAVSYYRGCSLLLAHALKDQVRRLESGADQNDAPSIPNLLAGLLGSLEPDEED